MSTHYWPAPAKINRLLLINGRRADGYHLLQTVFQFLDIGDEIGLSVRTDGAIRRVTEVPGVAADDDLTVRAARKLQHAAAISLGADIDVRKTIPMGGGLGGGSSDAATVLVVLNRLWNTGLSVDALAALGLGLGADVPVFVHGQAAWAEGVGEVLTPVDLSEPWVVVIHPGCAVATREIFTDPELTRDTPRIRMHDLSAVGYRNDCEPVVRRLYPAVDQALEWLARFGQACLTGTGACVYSLFDSRADAERVARQIPAQWSGFLARASNRSALYADAELAAGQ